MQANSGKAKTSRTTLRMSHASLAARYRPQTFAEVTGQDTIKTILSRAAAEDRVAPAYLLSGTRGVGKTTLARIFAKALNCVHAPVGEPCNQCDACRSITQGSYVDVIEIDGASNRGIDDARRLRETIGYAPMEGRYKVFIIDEAHMLTKESFNALLKTLEEPPPHATFILATTEPHKFPVTIVSRCQHFVFKALSETELVGHLKKVLERESLTYEENAVRLIARRAAGSVRDSMSLLGQTLALGGSVLTEASTRAVLGLAGQELYANLLDAISRQDCVAVATLTRELLTTGADIGFFLRELGLLWRNLFLLRQNGSLALPLIDMPESEKAHLLSLAEHFELSVIHAAWQMTLEGQRQVLTSLEPSAALELLLLNLALLPRLASMELLSRAGTAGSQPPSQASFHAPRTRTQAEAAESASSPMAPASAQARRDTIPSKAGKPVISTPAGGKPPLPDTKDGGAGSLERNRQKTAPASRSMPESAAGAHATVSLSESAAPASAAIPASRLPHAQASSGQDSDTPRHTPEVSSAAATAGEWPCPWETLRQFCLEHLTPDMPLHAMHLQRVQGNCCTRDVTLRVGSQLEYDNLADPERQACLQRLVGLYAGKPIPIRLLPPERTIVTEGDLKERMASHEAVRLLQEHFDASLLRCTLIRPSDSSGKDAPSSH